MLSPFLCHLASSFFCIVAVRVLDFEKSAAWATGAGAKAFFCKSGLFDVESTQTFTILHLKFFSVKPSVKVLFSELSAKLALCSAASFAVLCSFILELYSVSSGPSKSFSFS